MQSMVPTSPFLSDCRETRRGPGLELPAGVTFELAQGETLGLRAAAPRFTSFATASILPRVAPWANSNVTPAGGSAPETFHPVRSTSRTPNVPPRRSLLRLPATRF